MRYLLLTLLAATFTFASLGCERPKQLPLKMRDALNAGDNSYQPKSFALQSKPFPKKKDPPPPGDEWKLENAPGSTPSEAPR